MASVRVGQVGDAGAIGRLLHDFNTEYGEQTPSPQKLAERIGQLLGEGQMVVLLGWLDEPGAAAAGTDRDSDSGRGPNSLAEPDGLAVLRFRPAIWSEALECYLAELYVVPARRGHGLGRALMHAAIDLARDRGADHMDLGTGETDLAARALYESLGFSNREGGPEGPLSYYYEREL
jgi:GNAT superfamily N-acetyltransferase